MTKKSRKDGKVRRALRKVKELNGSPINGVRNLVSRVRIKSEVQRLWVFVDVILDGDDGEGLAHFSKLKGDRVRDDGPILIDELVVLRLGRLVTSRANEGAAESVANRGRVASVFHGSDAKLGLDGSEWPGAADNDGAVVHVQVGRILLEGGSVGCLQRKGDFSGRVSHQAARGGEVGDAVVGLGVEKEKVVVCREENLVGISNTITVLVAIGNLQAEKVLRGQRDGPKAEEET